VNIPEGSCIKTIAIPPVGKTIEVPNRDALYLYCESMLAQLPEERRAPYMECGKVCLPYVQDVLKAVYNLPPDAEPASPAICLAATVAIMLEIARQEGWE
jgi:hypothetical protein